MLKAEKICRSATMRAPSGGVSGSTTIAQAADVILGPVVERFEAEAPSGPRNRIGTVLISRVEGLDHGHVDESYAEPHADVPRAH
mgnify:CR=1 FL=1